MAKYLSRTKIKKLHRDMIERLEETNAQTAVHEYEQRIHVLTTLHHTVSTPIKWHEIAETPAPFPTNSIGPNEAKIQRKLEKIQNNWVYRILGLVHRRINKLEQSLLAAKNLDEQLLLEWQRTHDEALAVLEGDFQTFHLILQQRKRALQHVGIGKNYSFQIPFPKVLSIQYELNAKHHVPEEALSLTPTGKLSRRKLSATAYHHILQDYICSGALRLAREAFAILPFEQVYIHTHDTQINPATGKAEQICILSVRIDRAWLEQLQLERIDPSATIENMEHQMDLKKTIGFKPVQMLTEMSS